MLKGFAARWGTAVEAEDLMDDGSPIRLRVQVDPREVSRRSGVMETPQYPENSPKMGVGGVWGCGATLVSSPPHPGQRRV